MTKMHVPAAGALHLADYGLKSATIQIEKPANSEPVYTFKGTVELIPDVKVKLEVAFKKPAQKPYSFLIKMNITDSIDLGDLLGISLMQGIMFTQHSTSKLLGFIVTDSDEAWKNTYKPLIQGVNFYGGFAVERKEEGQKEDVFSFISKLTGIEQIDLYIGASEDIFSLEASLGLHRPLIPDIVTLSKMGLAAKVSYKPPEEEIKMTAGLQVEVPSDTLQFTGAISFTATPAGVGAAAAFTMAGKWVEPLGFPGISVADMASQFGVMAKFPWLREFGITGKMEVGSTDMALALHVDLNSPQKAGFIAKGSDIKMGQMINTLTGPEINVPSEITGVVDSIYLDQLELRCVPQPFTIGEISFTETGITVLGDTHIFDWRGFMYFRADYDEGIEAYANVDKIDIAGGFIEVRKANDIIDPKVKLPSKFPELTGPLFYLNLTPTGAPEAYLNASVTVFALKADAQLLLRTNQIKADISGPIFGLFQVSLTFEAHSDLSEVYLKVILGADFFHELTAMVRDLIDEEIGVAKKKIEQAAQNIREAEQEINRVTEAWDDAIRPLLTAVHKAQKIVDDLGDEIDETKDDIKELEDKLKHMNWKKPWGVFKKPKEAAELAEKETYLYVTLEPAKFLADGALDVAEEALKAFKKANPLEPLLAPVNGVLKLTEEGLEGTKAAVGGIAALTEKILEFQSEFFDVRAAMFEGEFSRKPANESYVHLKAQIVFLSNAKDVEFGIDLQDLRKGAYGLVDDLLKPLGDTDFVPTVYKIPIIKDLPF